MKINVMSSMDLGWSSEVAGDRNVCEGVGRGPAQDRVVMGTMPKCKRHITSDGISHHAAPAD